MKIELNSWNIAIAGGVFFAGIVLGRVSSPARHEQEQKSEAVVTTIKAKPGIKRSHVAPATLARPSMPAVTIIPGGSLFDGVEVHELESLARAAALSTDDIENESLLRVLVSEWAKRDPVAAITFAQGIERTDLMYDALRQMAKQNAGDALCWIEQHVKLADRKRYLEVAVFQGLAKTDPKAAVSFVEQIPPGAQRDRLLSVTVRQWAEQDIHAVFDWLETAEQTPQFASMYTEVMGDYIEQDAVQAASLVAEMESCENKLCLAPQVACKLAEQDVDHALEWVQELAGDEKKYSLMGVLDRWASGPDGKEALIYILEHSDEHEYQDLLATVAVKMSLNHPEELEAAFESMSASDQIVAAEQLAAVYSRDDSDKCNEWLASLDAGPVRDSAVERALQTFTSSDVSMAFSLSESISSDSLRKTQIREVMTTWIPVDYQSAELALNESSALSAAEKEDLLSQIYKKLNLNDYVLPEK
jgi:hypothetical protein